MDENSFDDLVRRLATVRLTRWSALRGLAATFALALPGAALLSDDAEARKKGCKKGKKGKRRRKVCHCKGRTNDSCKTRRLSRKKTNRHLRQHECDYRGQCKGNNPCSPEGRPGFPIDHDLGKVGNQCNTDADCGTDSGLRCAGNVGAKVCLPTDLNDACERNAQCSTGRCVAGTSVCGLCPAVRICGTGNDAECCVAEAECDQGFDACVFPNS